MKTFKKLALVLSVVTVGFMSCKDDDVPSNTTTSLRLMQHDWLVDSVVLYGHAISPVKDSTITYKGTASDHYNFRTDGKVAWQVNNSKDSGQYDMTDAQTVTLTTSDNSKIVGTITLLNDNRFVSTSKQTTNIPAGYDYLQTTLYLRR